MHLGEYLMHAWLDLVTKLQKYTPFAYSWSTSEECKKWDVVFISNQGSDIDWMERYQIVEARVCFRGLLPKILRSWANSTKFKQGLVEESVACGQDKNDQKMGIKY